jgi:hypothetical protein
MLRLLIGHAIVDEEPVLTVSDHPGLPQHAQLLGHIGLGSVQYRLEVTHAGLVPPKLVQDAETGWVGQEVEQVGCLLM